MLFCPSFTQSERFLQTDQLIIRLQVVVVINFISMLMRNAFENVFKSDAVVWWAATFCTPSSTRDKLLHLSNSKSFAMSCSRSCNLFEAVGNLLTVTLYLQDTLSRFHRPGLQKIDLRVYVASAPTRTLALHKSKSCRAVSAQHNHSRRAIAQFAPLLSRCDSFASTTNQRHQLGFSRTQTKHVLFLGRRIHGIPVFSTEPLTHTAIPEQLRRSLTSPAQSASVITTTEPCGMSAIPGTSRLQPTIMLHAGFPTKYLSKRLMLISSRVVAVPT